MRRLRLLPALAVPVLALSGCGVAGTQFHPGVAAQVGDVQLTTRHVDSLTHGYCQAIEEVSEDSGGAQQIPLRYLAHEFTTTLVIKAAAEQLAEDYDVEPGATYQQALAALAPEVAPLSESQRDAVLEIAGAQAYYQDVLTQIGGIELEGDDASSADPTDADKATAGQEVLDEWMADHDVEVNPKYGIEYGTAAQVDTDTSFAVSTQATDGLLEQPSERYASSLPDQMVCGG